MQIILKNPGQVNQETIAMEIKFKLKEKLLQWKRRTRKSVLKAAWIRKGGGSEQRWRITDGQDREWVEESQRDWKCSLKHVEAALDQ